MTKRGTSHRLSEGALEAIAGLAGIYGLSHAGAVELAVRQALRWARSAPPPGDIEEDLAKVREEEPPPTKKPRGRPRKT